MRWDKILRVRCPCDKPLLYFNFGVSSDRLEPYFVEIELGAAVRRQAQEFLRPVESLKDFVVSQILLPQQSTHARGHPLSAS